MRAIFADDTVGNQGYHRPFAEIPDQPGLWGAVAYWGAGEQKTRMIQLLHSQTEPLASPCIGGYIRSNARGSLIYFVFNPKYNPHVRTICPGDKFILRRAQEHVGMEIFKVCILPLGSHPNDHSSTRPVDTLAILHPQHVTQGPVVHPWVPTASTSCRRQTRPTMGLQGAAVCPPTPRESSSLNIPSSRVPQGAAVWGLVSLALQ